MEISKSPSQQLLSDNQETELDLYNPVIRKPTQNKTYLKKLLNCPCCGRSPLQDAFYFNMLNRLSNQQLYRNFQVICRIGSGSFGTVIKVKHFLNNQELNTYAIKQIPIDEYQTPWIKKVLSEVEILQQLYHQNVVRYFYSWVEQVKTNINDIERDHLMILLEYAKAGSLTNLKFKTLNRILTEEEFLFLLIQAAQALNHLHSLKIVSRDVKPENFLLTGILPETNQESIRVNGELSILEAKQIKRDRDPENINKRQQINYIKRYGIKNLVLKIADFGQIGDGISAGTEILTAPEVFETGKHSFSSDIYSLGLSFIQLVTQVDLIEDVGRYQEQLRDAFLGLEYSKDSKILMEKILDERISAEEIVKIGTFLIQQISKQNTRLEVKKDGNYMVNDYYQVIKDMNQDSQQERQNCITEIDFFKESAQCSQKEQAKKIIEYSDFGKIICLLVVILGLQLIILFRQ